MKKPKQISQRQLSARGAWASQIIDDILAQRPESKDGEALSSRELGELLGLSHTAPLNWLRGLSMPTPAQTVKLAKLAGRDPVLEILVVEQLRTTDKGVRGAYELLEHVYGLDR